MKITTTKTFTIGGKDYSEAHCEAMWMDFDRGTFAQAIADQMGIPLLHASKLIFEGKKIHKGE